MTRMEIEIFDDEDGQRDSLWKVLVEVEQEIAAKEGRAPQGWWWREGMDRPEPVFPESEEPPE